MTTDLIDKKIAVKVELSSGVVTVGGMCKGSGMIHPNMATMLGFVTTDVVVEPGVWSSLVRGSTTRSFNQITVDGDTSTNDCVLALASGGSGIKAESKDDVQKLGEALDACCIHLAKSIARDGEGATILLQIEVRRERKENRGANSQFSELRRLLTFLFSHVPNRYPARKRMKTQQRLQKPLPEAVWSRVPSLDAIQTGDGSQRLLVAQECSLLRRI